MNEPLSDYQKWVELKLDNAKDGGEEHLYGDALFVLEQYLSEQEER